MPSFIAERLSKGFQLFGKYSRGFLTNEATMIGVETRTSAPVRITRDKETLQHVRVKDCSLAEKAPDMPEALFLPELTANDVRKRQRHSLIKL